MGSMKPKKQIEQIQYDGLYVELRELELVSDQFRREIGLFFDHDYGLDMISDFATYYLVNSIKNEA